MITPAEVLAALFAAGAAIGAYALLAPKAPTASAEAPETPAVETPSAEAQPVPQPAAAAAPDALDDARAEFAKLPETARCELLFAAAALDDAHSSRLLVHALDDPSEAVALAAAYGLVRNGRADELHAYVRLNPGARARTVAQTLAMLGSAGEP